MNPTLEKFLSILLGAGLAILAVQPFASGAKEVLLIAAGGLLGYVVPNSGSRAAMREVKARSSIAPIAMLFLITLGGCIPGETDATALEAQRALQQSRDKLHELSGEARGVYAASSLLCEGAPALPLLAKVCDGAEFAYDGFGRGYKATATALNAAQQGLLAYDAVATTITALEALLDGVEDMLEEVTNAAVATTARDPGPDNSGGDQGAGQAGAEAPSPSPGPSGLGAGATQPPGASP